jgi:dipicolinate synthase subunit B
MQGVNCGFALTGSFCVFDKVIPQIELLVKNKVNVIPIMSQSVYNTDTRFFKACDLIDKIDKITGRLPLHTITAVEPIGPNKLTDILVIAPCTGNSLAKLAAGITDSPALMAAKSTLRNSRPVVIAISTNDALSTNAQNIGRLLARKNIYFVPFGQDNHVSKPNSLVARMDLIYDTCVCALEGKQIQPLLLG